MATYYVDGAVGDDANLGTSAGAGNAWKTIDKAMNTAQTADDKVYVKASATYSEMATIDVASSARETPITYEGYTTTPGDGGRATIDGGGVRANAIASGLGAANAFYVFKNFVAQNCAGVGFNIGVDTDYVVFKNCVATANTSWGFQCDNYCVFVGCKSYGNTGGGGIDADGSTVVIGCDCHSNTGYGVRLLDGMLIGCLLYNNSIQPFEMGGIAFPNAVIGCTIDGDGVAASIGIELTSGAALPLLCVNNIIYDCSTGISSGRDMGEWNVHWNNLLNANTANYSNFTLDGYNIVTGAPAFTDEAGDDYTLATASPAKAAGLDAGAVIGTGYMDIGALQRQEAGGSAGMKRIVGMAGSMRG